MTACKHKLNEVYCCAENNAYLPGLEEASSCQFLHRAADLPRPQINL